MCGICGIVNFKGKAVDAETLRKMNSLLAHRGPDDEGSFFSAARGGSPGVGLAMRRLSIIDLETGSQPIFNEDKSVVVVCNGEIYNFLSLRKELEEKGHRFYTRSDTETIVHLYEEYGEDCLKRMNGMFAFAIWDAKKERLFIARDRIGKKPLYYTWIKGDFYFSSEMKSFLAAPGFEKKVNEKAVHYFLTYQYIPSPMTIWKNVRRLEPASFLTLNKDGALREDRYWDIDFTKKTELDFEEAKEKLRLIVKEAVTSRMISDVPLGAFLSGGIDSTIITALMSAASSKPVKTFTVGFEDKAFSETEAASSTARRFNTEHHELIVKADYMDILPKIVWHYDQPYADSSALPSFYVSKMTAEHVKVALNGDGGDENFAGYLRYKALKISQIAAIPFKLVPGGAVEYLLEKTRGVRAADSARLVRYLHRFVQPLKQSPARRNLIWHAAFTKELKNFIYSEDFKRKFADDDSYSYLEDKFSSAPAGGIIDRALWADLTAYLPEDLLVKMDIASMANSLEARSPFLDYNVIEFAASLPSTWKLRGLSSKYILKEAFKDILPDDIARRPKQGFGIPLAGWFRGEWLPYLKETVLSDRAARRGYFNMANVAKLVDDHAESRADYGYCLWALLMLELWHRVFIDGDPSYCGGQQGL